MKPNFTVKKTYGDFVTCITLNPGDKRLPYIKSEFYNSGLRYVTVSRFPLNNQREVTL